MLPERGRTELRYINTYNSFKKNGNRKGKIAKECAAAD